MALEPTPNGHAIAGCSADVGSNVAIVQGVDPVFGGGSVLIWGGAPYFGFLRRLLLRGLVSGVAGMAGASSLIRMPS